MQFTNRVMIRRSPAEVFSFLSDFENVPTWNYAISETRKTSLGPVAVGSTYHQSRSVPSPSEERFRVVELEQARRLAIHGDLGPFNGTLTYELERIDQGVLLTNTAHLEGRGALRFGEALLRSRVQAAVAANLEKLKEILER